MIRRHATLESRRKMSVAHRRRYGNLVRKVGLNNGRKYWRVYLLDRWVCEQRVIAERVLGRPLKRSEVVHHWDDDGLNNEHSNLLICSRGYHIWLHHKLKRLQRPPVIVRLCCCGCGSVLLSQHSKYAQGHNTRSVRWKRIMQQKFRGCFVSQETRDKISESLRGRPRTPHTDATRRKLSRLARQRWARWRKERCV